MQLSTRERWLVVSALLSGCALGLLVLSAFMLIAAARQDAAAYIMRVERFAIFAATTAILTSLLIKIRTNPPGPPFLPRLLRRLKR
jgi:hypothetical protein